MRKQEVQRKEETGRDQAGTEKQAKAKKLSGGMKKSITDKKQKKDSGQKTEHTPAQTSVVFFRGIQFRLILSFLVPVICIVVLGVSSYMTASNAITKSYEGSVEQTMSMMNQYLTLAVDTMQTSYKGYLDDDDLKSYVRGQKDSAAAYNKITSTALSGNVSTNEMLAGVYFLSDTQEPITTAAVAGKDAYQAFVDSVQGQLIAQDKMSYFLFGSQSSANEAMNTDSSKYGLRLARRMKSVNAYMIVDISYKKVRETLTSLDAGEGSYVALITCDGVEFVTENGEVVTPENPIFTDKEFYQEALASGENAGIEAVSFDGESYQFLYSVIEGRDAMIATLISEDTILAQADGIKQLTMIISMIAVLIAGLLGTLIARNFGHAIRTMVSKLKQIAKGDLTVEVRTKRKDEFSLLAEGINSMTANMKRLITNVNDLSGSLTRAAGQVSESSNMFLQTAKDIQLSISEIEQGVNRLDTDSEDCLNQMDGLSGKITSVSENAGEISRLTTTTSDSISDGIHSMTMLTDSAKSTTEITSQVIAAIEQLEEKSRSISQIVNAINEIASQTNLLSLNASIEAARAGEAGRGFAVVAEEIRKLADQSLASAHQIGAIIEEIISNTGEVVGIARQAESVVSSQEAVVASTTHSFEAIDEQVLELMKALEMISESVKDMDGDRSATLGAIESISAVSAQAAASSKEVYTTADTQLSSIQTLEDASAHLKKRATQLSELLQQFTL